MTNWHCIVELWNIVKHCEFSIQRTRETLLARVALTTSRVTLNPCTGKCYVSFLQRALFCTGAVGQYVPASTGNKPMHWTSQMERRKLVHCPPVIQKWAIPLWTNTKADFTRLSILQPSWKIRRSGTGTKRNSDNVQCMIIRDTVWDLGNQLWICRLQTELSTGTAQQGLWLCSLERHFSKYSTRGNGLQTHKSRSKWEQVMEKKTSLLFTTGITRKHTEICFVIAARKEIWRSFVDQKKENVKNVSRLTIIVRFKPLMF